MVMAGQGTVGIEMLEDDPSLEVLVVPVGGGGLIAGIATAARHLSPGIEIVGEQSGLDAGMAAHLGMAARGGAGGPTVAEGIAVREPGQLSRGGHVAVRSCPACRRSSRRAPTVDEIEAGCA